MKLRCKLKGHRLEPISKNNLLIKEFECSVCEKKFTTDGYGKLVKLTPYWKENNLFFEKKLSTGFSTLVH